MYSQLHHCFSVVQFEYSLKLCHCLQGVAVCVARGKQRCVPAVLTLPHPNSPHICMLMQLCQKLCYRSLARQGKRRKTPNWNLFEFHSSIVPGGRNGPSSPHLSFLHFLHSHHFMFWKQLLSDGAHFSFWLCRSQPTLAIISLPGCHKCPCKPFCRGLILTCWHDIQFCCH